MRFKKVFFLLVFVFSFVTSCRSSRQVVQKNDRQKEIIKKDIVTYKDTVFFTPNSKTTLKLPFKGYLNSIKTPKVYTQKNGNSTVKLRIERDTIIVSAVCDSLKIKAKLKERYQSEFNHIENNLSKLEEIKRGFSLFEIILYTLSAFIIGLGLGVLLKTLKLI